MTPPSAVASPDAPSVLPRRSATLLIDGSTTRLYGVPETSSSMIATWGFVAWPIAIASVVMAPIGVWPLATAVSAVAASFVNTRLRSKPAFLKMPALWPTM